MIEKKDMRNNFNMIIPRLDDSFNHLDNEKTTYILQNIKHNCLCVGTGGSNAVSLFASIVLEKINGIIATSKEPRDIMYMNLFKAKYGHLLGITYGNNNYGINEAEIYARENKYITNLLTANNPGEDDIYYGGNIPLEYSFISLASTILPMSIMLNYYLSNKKEATLELIKDLYAKVSKKEFNLDIQTEVPVFEIMSGDQTIVASKVLESTIIEAGLGIAVIHDKYSYCHGRSTLVHTYKNSNLIYLINEVSNIDNKLLEVLKDSYKNIIILKANNINGIVGEFDLALQSLMLCKAIAEKEEKDLSIVNYSPVVKKLYKYNGGM
jgi:hypothetical protein